jgi:hypothetical protein
MTTATADAPRDKTKDSDTGTDERATGRDVAAAAEDRDAKRLRLSNAHHGHVLDHIRRLHTEARGGCTITREHLAELLELAEAAHSNPTPQPESGSVVHGTTGPGAHPDIHHTPFSRAERDRQPGQ